MVPFLLSRYVAFLKSVTLYPVFMASSHLIASLRGFEFPVYWSWPKNTEQNQHHFLDHVQLGCTQRECKIGKIMVDNVRSMFESRISAGATEKLPETKASEKLDAETTSS